MRRLLVSLLAVVTLGACAEPPSKEMNQAQGAIDAARAAGADRFAVDELRAAVEALQRSEEAAAQRDYRLALNHAIDSRERAQIAAKTAVTARSQTRGDLERRIAEAAALIGRARELVDPPASSVPRRTVQQARTVLEAAAKSLQDARSALSADDYQTAGKAIDGLSDRLQKTIGSLEPPAPASAPRKRR